MNKINRDIYKQTYKESAKEIPVIGEYDVIVAGSGPSGCAAALAAAGYGAKVLLIEKEGFPGGAPATQFIISVLSTNCVDLQGIWHDWIRKVKDLRGITGLVHHYKPMAEYILTSLLDPEAVKYAWDIMLGEAGVCTLNYCLCADAIVEDNAIKGIILESVAGRQAVYGKRVVDCTGDGAVCHSAGVEWEQGSGSSIYAMASSMSAYLGNISKRDVPMTPEEVRLVIEKYETEKKHIGINENDISVKQLVNFGMNTGKRTQPNSRCLGPGKFLYKVDGLNPVDLTRAVRDGREHAWKFTELLRRCVDGQENAYVSATPNQIGLRSSRRIAGLEKVTYEDVWEFRKYKGSIAKGSWDIDIYDPYKYQGWSVPRHTREYQERIEKMKMGEFYDIRYGAIVAKGIDNLLMAGRCISSDHAAQSSLRIQQTCISTGQAAGTAAAISINDNVTPGLLDAVKLSEQLEKDRDVQPAFECISMCNISGCK